MNILLIDHNDLKSCIEKLASETQKIEIVPSDYFSKSIANFAKSIYVKYRDIDFIFINVNLVVSGSASADCVGITLLKYLRFYKMDQHCVLYSLFSREELMLQSPFNLIIFSEGVSFVQLPGKLESLDIESLWKKKAPQDLSSFFKAESDIEVNRHATANWWGVLQLWQVHQALHGNAEEFAISSGIDKLFTAKSLELIHSYYGMLSKYLYGFDAADIRDVLGYTQEQLEQRKAEESVIMSNLDQLEKEYEALSKEIKSIEDTYQKFSEAEVNNLTGIIPWFKQWNEKREQDSLFNRKEKIISPLLIKDAEIKDSDKISNTELINTQIEIEKIKANIDAEIDKIKINILVKREKIKLLIKDLKRPLLNKEKPSIIYVDDNANDGWAIVFQKIIYGEECEKFTVVQPTKEMDTDAIVTQICEAIDDKQKKEEHVQLIILDLRLKGEVGNNLKPEDISGIQVLKKLKEKRLPCPVLITTASNKINSLINTLSDANAFWIKEGIDSNQSIEQTVQNYSNFIDLVHALCLSSEYTILYDFKKNIEKIRNQETKFWWEGDFWSENVIAYTKKESNSKYANSFSWFKEPEKYPKNRFITKTELLLILDEAFLTLKNYLDRSMLLSVEEPTIGNTIASVFVLRCFSILEIIHSFDLNPEVNAWTTFTIKINSQLSRDCELIKKAFELSNIRNNAVHYFNADNNNVQKFLVYFGEYIDYKTNK